MILYLCAVSSIGAASSEHFLCKVLEKLCSQTRILHSSAVAHGRESKHNFVAVISGGRGTSQGVVLQLLRGGLAIIRIVREVAQDGSMWLDRKMVVDVEPVVRCVRLSKTVNVSYYNEHVM